MQTMFTELDFFLRERTVEVFAYEAATPRNALRSILTQFN